MEKVRRKWRIERAAYLNMLKMHCKYDLPFLQLRLCTIRTTTVSN